LVYDGDLEFGACSREEIRRSLRVGEAGEAFRKLMEYLEELARG